ncbi:MAG: type II toxin-antitoxin system VapC family toxin [Rhizomicrobium sp.]
MVIDTSAVLAIFQQEAECPVFARAIADAVRVWLCAINYVECATVIESRHGPRGKEWFDGFLTDGHIDIAPVDIDTANRARRAYATFGKGRHPAGLNLADVFAYALAKSLNEPLLFKGEDFAKTDIASAV